MNPFFFASTDHPLFGVHHPPRTRTGRRRGVVLCYPFGVEYMRAHRAFRQLTARLTKAGHHVLRFDYFGTGDSSGAGEEGSLSQWRLDVNAAVTELREAAQLPRVTLVGLRLGATLAWKVAGEREDIERVVMWDPVVSGAAYLEQLLSPLPSTAVANGTTARVAGVDSGRRAPQEEEVNRQPALRTLAISGFPMNATLQEELGSIDLALEVPSGSPTPVDLVVSREAAHFRRLRAHFSAHGRLHRYHLVPSDGNWAEGDAFGTVVLPQGIVQTVAACVEGSLGS